jgi:glucose-6-phosphate isomerase
MANAQVAREWFLAQGGTDIARHFAATTTNVAAAAAFGIHTTFGFWDWVGGRYSLWSAIGLPIAIAIGAENFRALLAGAHAMDRHFARRRWRTTCRAAGAARRLVPQLPRLHQPQRGALPPGPEAPAGLPAAAGDGVQRQARRPGRRRRCPATSPVVWGEPGTNGQHAYFQMLHQGSDVIPVEFIAVKTPAHGLPTSTPSCWPTAWRRARR